MTGEMLTQYNGLKNKIVQVIGQGLVNEAFSMIQELIQAVPNDPELFSMLCTIYYQKNDLRNAEIEASKGLILEPTHQDLLYNLSFILIQSGKKADARFLLPYAIKFVQDKGLLQELYEQNELLEREYQLSSEGQVSEQDLCNEFNNRLLRDVYVNFFNHYLFNVDIEYMNRVNLPIRGNELVNTKQERLAIINHFHQLSRAYDLLHDETSKSLFVILLTYRILGSLKVQLPLFSDAQWKEKKRVEEWICSSETLVSPYHQWPLRHFRVENAPESAELYLTSSGVYCTFGLGQYEHHFDKYHIKAQPGDVVIDCGGCWGDTALYFAREVKSTGHVYTMEFIPSNITIMKKNILMNPHLQNRITIVPNPVWDSSGEILQFVDRGPASMVSSVLENRDGQVETLHIDRLVDRYQTNRVDFIKMDIEGAELNALAGAAQTIRKDRPVLAISVYHQLSHFQEVPLYIAELVDDYIFTLKHCTVFMHETILFAIPREKLERYRN